MNTPDDKQLSLFGTPEPPPESSFYEWEIDQEEVEIQTNGSGSAQSQSEGLKLQFNDNTDTTKCQENLGRNATHTTNVKTLSTSTQNQNKQQSTGNFISKDSVQQKLPKLKEFQELQFMGYLNLMDTNLENKNDFPLLFLTETAIPSETTGIMPELMVSDRSFIEIPGNITTEKYQKTTTFITSTEIGETTESKTSNVFSKQNIQDNTTSVKKEELNQVKLRITQGQSKDWIQEKLIHRQDKQLQQSEDAQVLSGKLLKKEQNRQELIGSTFECLECCGQPDITRIDENSFCCFNCHQYLSQGPAVDEYKEREQKAKKLWTKFKIGDRVSHDAYQNVSFGVIKDLNSETVTIVWDTGDAKTIGSPVSTFEAAWILYFDLKRCVSFQRPKLSSSKTDLSIPCLVKQPKQPEVKGVIRKDEGDRFLVEVDGEGISISKLFVYPDLDNCSSKTAAAEQDRKVSDTSVKRSSKIISPSTESSSKSRRAKGEGSGHIYYRNVTRNGKDYRQAYYQWRENGKQRTKYISKKLLSKVEEAEAQKFPVSEILVLLGGMDKCSSKSSDTFNAPIKEEVLNTSTNSSSKVTPPSKRRKQGEGTGYIECKPIKRSGKEYKQYWYHYEEWREGDRVNKKSRYIPKRLVAKVQTMEADKAPVKMILEVLIGKDKRSTK